MNEANITSADPVEHPTFRIGDTDYKIKLGCGTLIRLKKAGVDIFESVPNDPQNLPHLQAVAAREAYKAQDDPTEEDIAEIKRLNLAIKTCEDRMSDHRRNWRGILDRGSLTDRTESAIKIIACAISTRKKEVSPEDIQDEISLDQIRDMLQVVSAAVKKAQTQIT